ncbi:uncharacterized protein LOC120129969 [Hibiscus syriacus]|uniref:uncharacterized protein LOC120129969 n=1 Tax=Hibiscus syriacus TaxID=106335 RepID=UPI001923B9E9|nr:uncharacterized protein LOC120129969 [Hibiscus syriacus]
MYGSNNVIIRRHLWQHLYDLNRSIGHLPWILGGDYNEFQNVTLDLDLHDHPFFGPSFSWSNKQMDSFFARKLDRVLVNSNWVSSFPISLVEFFSPVDSDHWLDRRELSSSSNNLNPYKESTYSAMNSSCCKKETIRVLVDDNGNRIETFDAMAYEILDLFSKLLGTTDSNVKGSDPQFLKDILNSSLPLELSSSLTMEITTEEIKEAIFCQVIYKAITKILVNMLSRFLPDLVTLIQYAFIKGRSIVDNTILAHELVKGYGRNSISLRCTLKIDLQKAFDTLSWDFISAVLKAMDIPLTFISWIEAYYTEALFSILFNGNLFGFFKGAIGIRQGKTVSVIGVIVALESFYEMSGLKLNAAKYSTGFNQGFLPVRYLGVPLVSKKLIEKDCDLLIGNIKLRLHFWSAKHLSYVGRLKLIRTVLYSIANYWFR